MKNIKIITLIFTSLIMLAACSSSEKTSSTDNQSAPNFTLVDLDGRTHSLEDYTGKKVYLKFWASWCSICLAGLEEVNALSTEETDFVVLTIVSPGYKNEKEVDAFKKWYSGVEEAPNMTVLLDNGGHIADQYKVRGYPTSAYIDSDGKLVQTLPGHVGNEQVIEKFVAIE